MARPKEIEPVSLEHAQQASLALKEAQEQLEDAIVLAHEAGNSIHQIAMAVGFSNHWVFKIIQGDLPNERPAGAWRSRGNSSSRSAQERDASRRG